MKRALFKKSCKEVSTISASWLSQQQFFLSYNYSTWKSQLKSALSPSFSIMLICISLFRWVSAPYSYHMYIPVQPLLIYIYRALSVWINCVCITESSYFAFLQDAYFDDESAEVVISSLRLGDDQERWVDWVIWFHFLWYLCQNGNSLSARNVF